MFQKREIEELDQIRRGLSVAHLRARRALRLWSYCWRNSEEAVGVRDGRARQLAPPCSAVLRRPGARSQYGIDERDGMLAPTRRQAGGNASPCRLSETCTTVMEFLDERGSG